MPSPIVTRRTALKSAAAGLTAPAVFRSHANAAPSETLLHVSVGAGGRAGADVLELAASKHFKLVAVADVDADKAATLKAKFPDIRVYADWRVMFDKEKFDSVNVGTPDHTHAAPTVRSLKSGKHVYTQKPLTNTVHEARALALAAAQSKAVTQMGIQIHSHKAHKTVVAAVHAGMVGKVSEVHSWSGKQWSDAAGATPPRPDPVPPGLQWDLWLGAAAARPFVGNGYYHPGNWRKRLDFGTGTLGDMACHILDPVFSSLGLTAPTAFRSAGEPPAGTNWPRDGQVAFTFPATDRTVPDGVTVTWYNGTRRPPAAITDMVRPAKIGDQGTIYVGSTGVLFSPYIGMPKVFPRGGDGKFGAAIVPPEVAGGNHYLEWIEACRGNGATSTPFSYAGPLTETVLLGSVASRFPAATLEWDAAGLRVPNLAEANRHLRREYRKGWEEPGL